MRTKPKRVAIYARVSTDDRGQDPETQLRQLREYATRRDFEVVGEFVDYATGKNLDRPSYKQLVDAARKRKIEVVLVWRYDRFARSTQALINALMEFRGLGIDFISYQENVDTTTAQGQLYFTLISGFAEFESGLISERVKAGMARAKAEGKITHRPPIPEATRQKIAELWQQKRSINSIRKELGISYGTAWNYVQELSRI